MERFRLALAKGCLVAMGFFLATGVVTGLLPTSLFDRMVSRSLLDYAFLSLTSVLTGVYVVQRTSLTECSGDRCAYGGGAAGFFAVACPHCNAILASLFSATWLATYVDPIRPLLGLIAIALFTVVIASRRSLMS
ncbi:hypothetical protein EA462_09660 [Natrarchaeobius halalkaliphilus]|uniref:Uncharacterized protein n=1 Tax=Natrarchaeobius halalkaliphilus TaxID=1679091 RepID=A0A3N6M325_9EURY|nr:hypothetical protein [Natrarchaeobius halalkaliphilus]RQG90240.1 hypothetical protein EA462_09660 [Natrarchaeobius halalkaliphilus]